MAALKVMKNEDTGGQKTLSKHLSDSSIKSRTRRHQGRGPKKVHDSDSNIHRANPVGALAGRIGFHPIRKERDELVRESFIPGQSKGAPQCDPMVKTGKLPDELVIALTI